MTQGDLFDSIAVERDRLALVRADCKSGTTCRACGQYVRTWRWKFHSTLAVGLIRMVKRHNQGEEWVHVPSIEGRTHCLSRAALWGLVEKHPVNVDKTKRASGLWKATEKGMEFVYARVSIPSHVFVSDDTLLGYDESCLIDIRTALGKKFDYLELMNGDAN